MLFASATSKKNTAFAFATMKQQQQKKWWIQLFLVKDFIFDESPFSDEKLFCWKIRTPLCLL